MKNLILAASEYRKIKMKISKLDVKIAQLTSDKQVLQKQLKDLEEVLVNSDADKAYQQLTMTQAILKCLEVSKAEYSAAEITHQLFGGSFDFVTSSPYTSVYTICRKLSRRGIIKENVEHGRRVFSKK